jgi:TIR domain
MSEATRYRRSLRIFLCHSSNDKPAVRELYYRLKADGVDPWLDEEKLLPGQHWEEEIPKAVRDSDVVLVCLSRGSLTKTGYVQKEIKYALDVADEQPEGTIFLIPLKLEDCELPSRLRHLQCVNLNEKSGYDRLMTSLKVRAKTIAGAPIQIYDSRKHMSEFDFEGVGSYLGVDKDKRYGEGSFTVSDNLLSITRTNTVGSYLICFRRYYIGDEEELRIGKRNDLQRNRRLYFNCEARNTNSACKLAIVIVEYDKQEIRAHQFSNVSEDEWISVSSSIEFDPKEDCLLQLHQFDIQQPGCLELRNITIVVE